MLIILAIKILFDALYEVAGNPMSTNWNIAYNAINYLLLSSILLWVAENLGHRKRKIIVRNKSFIFWACNCLSMLYMSYAMIELTYINTPFVDYIDAMNEGYFAINYAGVVLATILFYIQILMLKKSKWTTIKQLLNL